MITVRDGTPSDIGACLALDGSFPSDRVLTIELAGVAPEHDVKLRWQQAKPQGSRRRHTFSPGEIESEIAKADRYWVAVDSDRLIGYVILRRIDWHPTTGDIVAIYVDLPHRGRGAGIALVETMKTYVLDSGLRGIFWEAQTDNYEAITFALRHGFRFAGFNDSFYRNNDRQKQLASDFEGVAIFLFWPAYSNIN